MKHNKLASLLITAAVLMAVKANAAQSSAVVGYNSLAVATDTDVLVSRPFNNGTTHTLLGMFPAALTNVAFVASPSGLNIKTLVLVYDDIATTNINRSSAAQYYYTANQWRKVGGGSTNYGTSNLVTASQHVKLRNQNNATALTYMSAGTVLFDEQGFVMVAGATVNDQYCATGRPLTMTLDELSLGGTSAFQTSPSGLNLKDVIYAYNNAATGLNKSSSAQYYYTSGQWRKVGGGSTNYGTSNVVNAAEGFLVRKATGGTTANWFNQSPVQEGLSR